MNELTRWVDDMFSGWKSYDPYYPWITWKVTDLAPKNYEFTEVDGKLVLTQDLPGVKLENLEITTEKQVLRVGGKRGQEKLSYTYDVRNEWDLTTTTATLTDGVLTVTIAKKELAPPPPVNKVLVTRG
jgi:HSP20 family molecular chaperone IbpA